MQREAWEKRFMEKRFTKEKFWAVWIFNGGYDISVGIVIFWMVQNYGCGPARPFLDAPSPEITVSQHSEKGSSTDDSEENSEKSQLPTKLAEALGLRVISEMSDKSDPRRPDPHAKLEEEVAQEFCTQVGNEIIFHKKFFLPDSELPGSQRNLEQFFVWSENFLGAPIVSATFYHRILNTQNQLVQSQGPLLVGHDREAHRWFIQISELFRNLKGYEEMNIDGQHTQEVVLELVLEKGPNVVVQIKFQVSGALPKIKSKISEPEKLPDSKSFVKAASNEGWIVLEEKISNPTTRPFTLWLRAKTPSLPLRLVTGIMTPTYLERSNHPPERGEPKYYHSTGGFQISTLEVEHEDKQGESHPLILDQWIGIPFHPKETLTLKWRAKRGIDVPHCSLPPSQWVNLYWLEIPPQTFRQETWIEKVEHVVVPKIIGHYGGVTPRAEYRDEVRSRSVANPLSPPLLKSIAVNIDWTIMGAELLGNWSREIRLAHLFTPKEDAIRDTSNDTHESSEVSQYLIASEEIKTDISPANVAVKTWDFLCQGVFR